MSAIYDQSGFDARFDWGVEGASELGRTSRVLIVVDLMSFSTAIDVAVSHGAAAYPCQFAKGASKALALTSRRNRDGRAPGYNFRPAVLTLAVNDGACPARHEDHRRITQRRTGITRGGEIRRNRFRRMPS